MTKDIKNLIAFYVEREDGSVDELIVDLFNKSYEHFEHIDKRDLLSFNNSRVKEYCIDDKLFNAIFDAAENNCDSGEFYYEEQSYEERQLEIKKNKELDKAKPIVSKEVLWKAIHWELEEDELNKILSYDFKYEKDNYYDFDLMINKIHRFMSGKVSVNYFTAWCIVLMRCFFEAMNCRSKKLQEVYDVVADYLDGFSFMDRDISDEDKLAECRELIADLKYYNHQLEDISGGKTTDFEKNGVIVYVGFAFSLDDGKDCAYNLCIVDKQRRLINYMIVYNIEYDEEINYTPLSEAEFNLLSSKYYRDYKLDTSLTADYQKRN